MKKIITLAFCFITFFTSFGQDSTRLNLNSIFKFHLSAGGSFVKNIEAQYLEPTSPLFFVESGIEVGNKVNFELNFGKAFGSLDTVNLNFAKVQVGVNSKSELNKNLSLVLRIGGGFIIANNDYIISEAEKSLEVRFLRIGGGLEQKISKESAMIFNLRYDISSNALFSGLGISVGMKMGLKGDEKEDVPYF